MANSVLIAKAKFLKADGLVIPGKGTLFLSPCDDKANGPLKEEFKKQTNKKRRDEYNYCTAEIDKDHTLKPE